MNDRHSLDVKFRDFVASTQSLANVLICSADRTNYKDSDVWKREVEVQSQFFVDSVRSVNKELIALKANVCATYPEFALAKEVLDLRERVSKQDTLLSTIKSKLDEWRASEVLNDTHVSDDT